MQMGLKYTKKNIMFLTKGLKFPKRTQHHLYEIILVEIMDYSTEHFKK